MTLEDRVAFREFLLRGLEKVKIEMNLISIAHNLLKIHRMMRENKRISGESSSVFHFIQKYAFSI